MKRRLSLSTLTASTIAAMLLLSVAIIYAGISWYSDRIESQLLEKLPPRVSQAYRDISAGKTPDRDDLMEFVTMLPAFNEEGNMRLYASIIGFSVLAAVFCSLIGYWLARRISRPLEILTVATDDLRAGNFAVRIPAMGKGASEIAALTDTFNALAADLDNMEKRLRFNTMAVAHELRTPLTVLQGSIQGMLDGVFPLDDRRLHLLLSQVEGLSRLVEDLRMLSLATAQKLVTERSRVDLALEAERLIDSARPILAAAGMTIETDLNPVRTTADSLRLRQAMLALVENCCRYAASGKVIRCETGRLGDHEAFVRIKDRGPGLPDELVSRSSLAMFITGDPSRSRATGG
ncbi:MAG: HAMP domain-containing protein, partial [Mesorhizobium sp.]